MLEERCGGGLLLALGLLFCPGLRMSLLVPLVAWETSPVGRLAEVSVAVRHQPKGMEGSGIQQWRIHQLAVVIYGHAARAR